MTGIYIWAIVILLIALCIAPWWLLLGVVLATIIVHSLICNK